MPNVDLQTNTGKKNGNVVTTTVNKSVTHNNSRLYHENGRTYEYIGNNAAGERIYRDTKKR